MARTSAAPLVSFIPALPRSGHVTDAGRSYFFTVTPGEGVTLRPQVAVLISAEVEAVEIEAALAAIFATAFEDTPAEAEIDRLSARWRAALDRMADTPAAGFAGLAAKARSVERLSRQADIETVAQLAPSLAADVLQLGRIAG